jgi:large subunit ribosomal protein L18
MEPTRRDGGDDTSREYEQVKRDANQERRRSRLRRHERVRKQVHGTSARPRLCVFRSLNHIYAQIIDDESGTTLAQASSLRVELAPVAQQAPEKAPDAPEKAEKGKDGKGQKKPARPLSLKMRRSVAVGKAIAAAAMAKGIKAVAFDRGGYLYHGRVAALAKAAREGGLEF